MSLPEGWREILYRDMIDIVIDNRGKNPKSYSELGIPVIDNFLISNERKINLSDVKRFIDDETYSNFLRKYIEPNDVLMTLVGNGYGNVALAPIVKSAIIQNTIGMRCNKDNDNIFLYYLFLYSKKQIVKLDIGAAQPSIKVGSLLALNCNVPPLQEQKAIANILSSFDEKIELLKEQNETLEQMAQGVFKESLNKFENSNKTTLGELVKIKYGKDHKHLEDGGFPLYGSGGVMRYVEKTLYDKESILIPRKGTLSNLFFIQEPFWSVDTIFYTEIDESLVSPIYLFYKLKRINLANLNVGSAVPSLTTNVLNALELEVPTRNAQEETVQLLTSFNNKVLYNKSQIKTLEKTRDTLLPKLMSGEVRVL